MFLFGEIDMQIKLIPGYSAGTVVAFYVSKFITLNYTVVHIYIYIYGEFSMFNDICNADDF